MRRGTKEYIHAELLNYQRSRNEIGRICRKLDEITMFLSPFTSDNQGGGAEHISPLRTSPIYQPKRYCQRGRSFLRRKRAPKKI